MISLHLHDKALSLKPYIRAYYNNDGVVTMQNPELQVLKEVFEDISQNLKLHESLNIYCGSCVCNALKVVEAYMPEPKAVPVASQKVISMVQQERKAKPKDPSKMSWAELKAYAKEKSIKVHGKKKEQILKELG